MDAKQAANTIQHKALARDAVVWISANAGTGKTEVLTRRMLALLLGDATLEPRHLLALTFTRAGASEMAARLPKRLAEWAALDGAALRAAIEHDLGMAAPEGARERVAHLLEMVRTKPPLVATIHGLAQQLLTRFAVEANVPVGFEVLEDAARKRLLAEVQAELLTTLEGPLEASLDVLLDELGEHGWRELTEIVMNGWRKLDELLAARSAGELSASLEQKLGLAGAGWAAAAMLPREDECAALARIAQALPQHALAGVLGAHDVEAAWKAALLTDRNTARARLFVKAELAKAGEADAALMAAAAARCEEQMRLRKVWQKYNITRALLAWGGAVKRAYDARKQAMGVLDYDDLLNALERLLVKADSGLAAWVWWGWDRRFRHLLLDEGQDNNPQQDRIVQWLAQTILSGDVDEAAPRTVLAVGDMKQSVYRFQGAVPENFAAMREALKRWSGERFVKVDLTHSFRSGANILAVTDAVFAGGGLAAAVTGDEGGGFWPRHESVHGGRPSRVELWPVVEAAKADVEGGGWVMPWQRESGDSAAIACMRQMATWLKEQVARGVVMPSTGRPLGYGDVMVLVQRNAMAATAAGVLRRAGIPAVLDAGAAPLAVQDVAALVRFVFNTGDNLALAQVLKGLRGWDDARLLALAEAAGEEPWLGHVDGGDRTWLEEYVAMAGGSPLALVQKAAMEAGGGLGVYARLLDWAEACRDLQELVVRLEGEDIPVAAGGEGVRVLTVHKAKGLQAPLVMMPDTMRMMDDVRDSLLFGEGVVLYRQRNSGAVCDFEKDLKEAEAARQKADSLRALYVAMTRAADWLVVGGFAKDAGKTENTWWGLVDGCGMGWREAEGVRVAGEDFAVAAVENVAAVAVDIPAWVRQAVAAPVAVVEGTEAQARGDTIHALLQGVAVKADGDVLAEVEGVKAALPWLFGPGARHEVAVGLAGGNVGRMDVLVEHDGDMWVVDFKTGAVPETVPAAYVRQLQGYAAAVRATWPGKRVRTGVAWTAAARLEEVAVA